MAQEAEYRRPKASNGTASHVAGPKKITETEDGCGHGSPIVDARELPEVMCGPLLNYKGMSGHGSLSVLWHGSVLLVTKPGHHFPKLKLKCTISHGEGSPSVSNVLGTVMNNGPPPRNLSSETPHEHYIFGEKLYEDTVKAFWRFDIHVPLQDHERLWEYTIASINLLSGASPRIRTFVVPSTTQSMRIMFYSCNGFSIGTDEEAWSGPALWNDVLRLHEQQPFHVMIGGGDQIYNDGVRVGEGPLQAWTNIGNPKRRRDYPFDEELRAACDSYYCSSYIDWYSAECFASANSQVPQINIWDDHGTLTLICADNAVADPENRHH